MIDLHCILERLSHFPFIVSRQFEICKLKTMWRIIDHRRLSAALKTSSYELPPANREIEFVFCGTPQKREVSDVNVYMQRLSWWAIKKLFVYFQSSCDEQLKYLISMSWYRHDDEIMLLDSFKAIEYMCCVYKKREREKRKRKTRENTNSTTALGRSIIIPVTFTCNSFKQWGKNRLFRSALESLGNT